jgi:hypothetical protein
VEFRSSDYGEAVRNVLAWAGDGLRPMPLAPSAPSVPDAENRLRALRTDDLFPNSASPQGALSGLHLYFSCLDSSHKISQDLSTADGSFWHGIMHRQEPDPANSAYWFRRVGAHPVFPALAAAARELGYPAGAKWDPFAFIDYCEAARRKPGSAEEKLAMQVQLAEWQLLFDHCARPGRTTS